MTLITPHPTLSDWTDWVRERLPSEAAAGMERHLGGCVQCRGNLEMLRTLRTARRMARWELPPASLRKQAARLPAVARAPRKPQRFRELPWRPADVRGQTLVAAPEPANLNAVLANAELSIVATPPTDDPFWCIEGRVWLRDPDMDRVEVVVVQDDHVLAHHTARSGEFFRIREVLPPGWELEVHLPNRSSVRLSNRTL